MKLLQYTFLVALILLDFGSGVEARDNLPGHAANTIDGPANRVPSHIDGSNKSGCGEEKEHATHSRRSKRQACRSDADCRPPTYCRHGYCGARHEFI